MRMHIVPGATFFALIFLVSAPPARAQQPKPVNAPLYKVTVVERTAKAINYAYRSGPTEVDFRGTVLLPHAKGDATVESRQGRTEIDAKLSGLASPQRYGGEYLTYVLWAITPEGRPRNIGELIPNSSDRASLHVTADVQAFALIVTAEPYSAVHQPSDLVVAENIPRPDTVGTIEPVEAKFELLPRGEYTWNVPSSLDQAAANLPKVSQHEYEALTELYQAQNAIGIAGNAGAERYAPDTYARAKQLLADAQQMQDQKAGFRSVVQSAREGSETAEDARVIAVRKSREAQLAAARADLTRTQQDLASARQSALQAAEQARQAHEQAEAVAAQASQAEAARAKAEADAAAAQQRAALARTEAQASRIDVARQQQALATARVRDNRFQLLESLKGVTPTTDTPRGLVATISANGFRGAEMRGDTPRQVDRIARLLANQSELHVSVQAYSAGASGDLLCQERADAVRHELTANGVDTSRVEAVGMGNSRPLASDRTAAGRMQNSRVEIVISGSAIGSLPLWDHTYSVSSLVQAPSEIRHQ